MAGDGSGQVSTAPDTRAESANRAWLLLVDTGRYAESWQAAAPEFQAALPQSKWEEALRGVRAPLGKVLDRRLQTAKFANSLPGAPDGEYIVTSYATDFEHKAKAVETVTATHEKDGSWRISGYFIR